MSWTCLCISCLRAYGVLYWGLLIGCASPTSIWCLITFVPVKSFVSSSWKTWAYFCNTGSICCLSSTVKWSSFQLSNFWYKASFFFCLGGFVGDSELDSLPAFILSISASDTSSAKPKMVALGMVGVSLLKFASKTCVEWSNFCAVSLWRRGN